jgi:hypothetical protein
VIRFVEGVVAFVSGKSKNKNKAQVETTSVSGQAQRLTLFGPPLLLEGEDAAVYEEFLARIRAAVNPVDIIDDIYIADLERFPAELNRGFPILCK